MTYTAYVLGDTPPSRGTPGTPILSSAPITISNLGYVSTSISLTTTAPTYSTNDALPTIHASADPWMSGGYALSVYDDDGNLKCQATTYNSGCSFTGSAPLNGNRTYTAYIAPYDQPEPGAPQDDIRAVSAPVTIINVGWVGTLTMTATDSADGKALTASVDESLGNSYAISIYNDTGSQICLTGGYSTACHQQVSLPSSGSRTYTAYVAQDYPTSGSPIDDVRAMGQIVVSSSGSVSTVSNGMNIDDLVAAMEAAGPEAIDEMWLAYTAARLGTHALDSEVTDQQLAYDAAIDAGKTAAEAWLAAFGTTAGAAVLAWYAYKYFSAVPTRPVAPNPPPPPPNPPTVSETAPQPAAPTFSYLDRITEDFIEHNPKAITWPEAQAGARTCILLTQYAIAKGDLTGAEASNPCEDLTIYLPGGEYPQTTQHDWDAIIDNPAWIRLNWQNPGDRGATLDRGWYDNTRPCKGNITRDTGDSCDEYPFYASKQSGPGASLRLLNHSQNTGAGRRYGWFADKARCDLKSDPTNSPFLVIPMYFDKAPRTFEVCN